METGYNFEVCGKDVNEYRCPICMLLLRDSVELPCTHTACKACLNSWENEQVENNNRVLKCPTCQSIYHKNKIHEGKFIDRIITTSLDVRCKAFNECCNWVGTIATYFEIHQYNCDYKEISCEYEGCDMTIKRIHLEEHMTHCLYKPFICSFCYSEMRQIVAQEHLSVCDLVVVECRINCGAYVERRSMETHLEDDCLFKEIACDYDAIGCTAKRKKYEMQNHMEECANQHIQLLLQYVMKINITFHQSDHTKTEEFKKLEMLIKVQKRKGVNKEQAFDRKIDYLQTLLNQEIGIRDNKISQIQRNCNKMKEDLTKMEQKLEDNERVRYEEQEKRNNYELMVLVLAIFAFCSHWKPGYYIVELLLVALILQLCNIVAKAVRNVRY